MTISQKIQRKLAETVTKERNRNMADAGNKDPQRRQPEECQEDGTGEEGTAATTEMYLPDLDNTPLSQALQNGLDWGMEDEVMVECPKLKQYLRGRHSPSPENLRMSLPTH